MSPSASPGRFQFSIGRILWAMFVCALLAWAVRSMAWSPIQAQTPLLVLLVVYALYAVFRLPYVLGDLRGRSAKWRRIEERRAELRQMIEERRPLPESRDDSAP